MSVLSLAARTVYSRYAESAIGVAGGPPVFGVMEIRTMHLLVQAGLVALGSACGGLARWGVVTTAGRWLGTALPYGTFAVNILGSLFLGWFLTILADRSLLSSSHWLRPDELRLALAVGFTGSFTTFSTFEWEAHGLFRDGDGLAGTGYILGSVLFGLLAVRAGVLLARAM